MGYEQIDFLDEADKQAFRDQEAKTNFEKAKEEVGPIRPETVHKPDDGLNTCEYCNDSGCQYCRGKKSLY